MFKKTFTLFSALITGLPDKAAQAALLNMQKSLDYCIEENKILREQLRIKYGCRRLILNNSQRRRLAAKAIHLGRHILSNITALFHPETILGWHRKLVATKYDSSIKPRKSGRPRVSAEIIEQVLRLPER